MKNLLYVLSFVFVAAAIFSCAKEAESSKIQGEVQVENRDNSVWLCHKPDGNNPHAVYVDENAVDAHLGHGDVLLDADNDGYTAPNACGEGSMDDCDDNNFDINPGVEEVPYDGIDNDCDPATLDDDLDEDGYIKADDCDDNNADINPGADEDCDNEVDDNCDGDVNEDCAPTCDDGVECVFCPYLQPCENIVTVGLLSYYIQLYFDNNTYVGAANGICDSYVVWYCAPNEGGCNGCTVISVTQDQYLDCRAILVNLSESCASNIKGKTTGGELGIGLEMINHDK